jgi:hypothetical protein
MIFFYLIKKEAVTEEDKERLGKIMAYGKDIEKWPAERRQIEQPDEDEMEMPEVDRFDERK